MLRWEADGSLVAHADLSGVSGYGWNEIVVDGRGTLGRLRDQHDQNVCCTVRRVPATMAG